MTYQNDRRSVEALTIPLGFSMVLVRGVSQEFADTKQQIHDLLSVNLREIVGNLEHKRRVKIIDRSRKAMHAGFLDEAMEQKTHAAKIGLALYYFTNNLIEQKLFYYAEGGTFDQALKLILPALEEWAAIDKFDKSSFKEAKRMLKRYQQAGYFKEATWVLAD